MSDAELMEMIERADTDQDGTYTTQLPVVQVHGAFSSFLTTDAGEISPDEFYAIMTKKTFT